MTDNRYNVAASCQAITSEQQMSEDLKNKTFPLKEEKNPFALFSTLPYYSILLLYSFIYYSIEYLRHPEICAIIIFSFLMFADNLFPQDWLNPTEIQSKKLASDANDIFFKIPLYISVIADWMLYFWVINHLSQQPFHFTYWLSTLFVSGVIISTNFSVGHELFHKHDTIGRFVGAFTMTKMLYTHFFIEHQYGHHKHVATPNDPATSRLNETIYEFLPRTILGSYLSAWNIEKRRLLEIEEYSTHWHPENRMIWYTLSYPGFLAVIWMLFGVVGMLISMCLAFMAVVSLETVNYIEHYGLKRKEVAPGEYERVTIRHSWNAPHRITNYILFKLQRHSDHHENASKPYQTLASYDGSPTLPHGYFFCCAMSFFPNFWFKAINVYATGYNKGIKVTEKEKLDACKSIKMFIVAYITLLMIETMITLKFYNR